MSSVIRIGFVMFSMVVCFRQEPINRLLFSLNTSEVGYSILQTSVFFFFAVINGAETNCRIAHTLGILLMNSCNTNIFFSNYYHLQSVRFEFLLCHKKAFAASKKKNVVWYSEDNYCCILSTGPPLLVDRSRCSSKLTVWVFFDSRNVSNNIGES